MSNTREGGRRGEQQRRSRVMSARQLEPLCAPFCKPTVKRRRRTSKCICGRLKDATIQAGRGMKQKTKESNMGESGGCGLRKMGLSGGQNRGVRRWT